jgi:competence protein ComEA
VIAYQQKSNVSEKKPFISLSGAASDKVVVKKPGLAVILVIGLAAAVMICLVFRFRQSGVVLLTSGTSVSGADVQASDTSSGAGGAIAESTDQGMIPEPTSTDQSHGQVSVYVSGAVNNSRVVCLADGSRLIDAVECSGGLADDAAIDYINLAARLVDGAHCYIPSNSDINALREQGVSLEYILFAGADLSTVSSWSGQSLSGSVNMTGSGSPPAISGDSTSSGGSATSAGGNTQAGFPVNINRADLTTLQTVPGIGPVTAQRIIDYRNQHGVYKTLDDLLGVSGIGAKRLADLRPYLTC